MTEKKHTLCLIDGSSYFYRAFFAIRSLTTSAGFPSNAIYGFSTMILKTLRDLNPDYISVIFDSSKETFRNKLYKEYKATRSEMPSDLVQQIPYIKEVIKAFHIHSFEKEGFEADDIIATICEKMKNEDISIVIVSTDKDLMQLVNEQVSLFDAMKDKQITEKEVFEKFGVSPKQVTDMLGLMGDTSDNIPGVPGIGPKTAAPLIQKYHSLENLLMHIHELQGSKKELLEKYKDDALLSKKLAILDHHVPLPEFSLKEFKKNPIHKELVAELFTKLEFRKLLESLGLQENILPDASTSSIKRDYKTIQTEIDFKELLKKISKVTHFVLDTETTSLNTKKADLVGLSLAYPFNSSHEACYLPLQHKEGVQLDFKEVINQLKPIFENPNIQKWGQNIKYDYLVLVNQGIYLQNISDDSMIASYVLDPSESHGMDALSLKYLKHLTIRYDDVTKKADSGKRIGFDEVPIDVATQYSGEDADVTYRLVETIREKLKEEEKKTFFVYQKIEMPLLPILIQMELDGVLVDISFLKKMSKRLGEDMKLLEEDIYKISGEIFNIQSPQQLAKILFEKLKLPVHRKTKTGFSTDVDVLESLAEKHPLPQKILSYRELMKLKSTYVDALIELADPTTHRVHTSYNQTVAETGRLSSSNPNLQNIPIRTDLGKKIRQAFIAKEGCELLGADYSQIELRLLAHLSDDATLIDAFRKDQDIHTQTACDVFHVSSKEVNSEMRRMAKAINFGLMYGLSSFGLSKQLDISQTKAQEYMDTYFNRYSNVKKYFERIIREAKEKGYVETLQGRKRYLAQLKSSNVQLRNMAERMAMNSPIQGAAADLIKMAMISIFNRLKKEKAETKMILQVHDELVFEVPKQEMTKVKALVKEEMENAFCLKVPLKVDISIGKNWGELT